MLKSRVLQTLRNLGAKRHFTTEIAAVPPVMLAATAPEHKAPCPHVPSNGLNLIFASSVAQPTLYSRRYVHTKLRFRDL
jgi:hypothetical protein